MGAELFRKHVSASIIICYRSVVRHPFLIGMVILLISMYRLFPLLFSLLVSASPVLVSTALLLGTLLSFGQPNIPEFEKESESDRDEIRKLESKVMSSHVETVGRDANFDSEEINGTRIEVGDKSFGEKISVNDDNSCVEIDRPVNLVGECEKLQSGEEHLVEESKNEMDEEKVVLGSHYSPLQQSEDEHIVLGSDDKLWEGSADPLNSDPGLLWKRVEGGGSEVDEGSDTGDSGSDIAESSSPDASMADIIPMLDELHPLLAEESEIHQPAQMSRDGTDAASEHSLGESDSSSSRESNENGDGENHEDLDVGIDEDKESKHTDKEDEIRSAITWTEDDQKNLMNLGTSELERNRRLENLIARRRARKIMRMQAEKNLIDLDSADLPWNISPISTARNNPFDYDSNDNIPGSAPSVLLQRRNPFDLPYDSSEEKPDLVGDTFQQEFGAFQPKEPFFRRYESFNVGPSVFGASRSERQETKLRPYFVPEQVASDGSFSSFQKQLSGLSDSKMSSLPDTDSVSSADDLENKDHTEDDHSLETEVVSEKDHERASERREQFESVSESEHPLDESNRVSDHFSRGRPYFVPEQVASSGASLFSFQRQLSEVSESKGSSVPDTESVSSADDLENKVHIEDDISQEAELISVEEHEHASEIREHPGLVSESENNLDESKHVSEHVSRRRPYFVPEQVASDGTSFSSFQRQLSEVSESKGSSVPDTESSSSADDLETKVHIEEDISQEAELISVEEQHVNASEIREQPDLVSESDHSLDESNHVSEHVSHGRPYFVPEPVASDGTSFSSFQRQLSEVSESKGSSVPDTESISSAGDFENKDHIEEDISQEAELISVEEHEHASGIGEHSELVFQGKHALEAREHVSQGSESSEDDGIVERIQGQKGDEGLEAEISLASVMNQQEVALELSRIENATSSVELMSDAVHLNLGDLELQRNASSLSSSFEASEQVYNKKEGDEVPASVSETAYYFVDRGNSMERSDIDITCFSVEESRLMEPRYDSSPRDVTRNPSSSSISNDLQAYISERGQVLAPSEITGSVSDSESRETEQKIDTCFPGNEFIDSSEAGVVSRSITDHNVQESELNLESSVEEDHLLTDESFQHTEDQQQSSSSVADVKSNSTDSTPEPRVAQNQLPTAPDNKDFLLAGDNISTSLPSKPLFETEDSLLDMHASHQLEEVQFPSSSSHARSLDGSHHKEVIYQLEESSLSGTSAGKGLAEDLEELQDHKFLQGQGASSDGESQFVEVVHGETYENTGPTHHQFVLEEEAISSQPPKEFPLLNLSANEASEENPDALQVQITNNSNNLRTQQPENAFPLNINSVLSVEPDEVEVAGIETTAPGNPAYVSDIHSIESNDAPGNIDDVDEIKEIDETLLVELDAVGDFSVKDLGSTSNEMKEEMDALEHHLETKHPVDEDSYSQDFGSTLKQIKQDPRDSENDLGTIRSIDEDSYSKDSKSPLNETRQDPNGLEHDIETDHSGDDDSASKDLGSNLNDMKEHPKTSEHALQTKHSGDEDSYSMDLGSTTNEMKQDPRALDRDLETNHSVDEDSNSKDLESTLNEMIQDPHALGHSLETFYSIDEFAFSKIVESTLNEMKQDPQALQHGLQTKYSSDEDPNNSDSSETKIKLDAEVMKSLDEKEISNTEVAGAAYEAEASRTEYISDDNEVVVPQETNSTTSSSNSTNNTMVSGAENVSSTSNAHKE